MSNYKSHIEQNFNFNINSIYANTCNATIIYIYIYIYIQQKRRIPREELFFCSNCVSYATIQLKANVGRWDAAETSPAEVFHGDVDGEDLLAITLLFHIHISSVFLPSFRVNRRSVGW